MKNKKYLPEICSSPIKVIKKTMGSIHEGVPAVHPDGNTLLSIDVIESGQIYTYSYVDMSLVWCCIDKSSGNGISRRLIFKSGELHDIV